MVHECLLHRLLGRIVPDPTESAWDIRPVHYLSSWFSLPRFAVVVARFNSLVTKPLLGEPCDPL